MEYAHNLMRTQACNVFEMFWVEYYALFSLWVGWATWSYRPGPQIVMMALNSECTGYTVGVLYTLRSCWVIKNRFYTRERIRGIRVSKFAEIIDILSNAEISTIFMVGGDN